MSFNYSDYIDFMQSKIKETDPSKIKATLEEIESLRNHTADPSVMQKHLKNFKMLKNLVENFNVNLFL